MGTFVQEMLADNMRVKFILMKESNAPEERKRYLNEYSEWPLKLGKEKIVSSVSGTNIIEVLKNMVHNTVRQLEESVYNYFHLNFNNRQYILN